MKEEKIIEQQVVILAGGQGRRMQSGIPCPKEEHRRLVVMKARCKDCGAELDNPFGEEVFVVERREK